MQKTMIISTPFGDIIVEADTDTGAGSVKLPKVLDISRHNEGVEAVVSMILAHACAGIDVDSDPYVDGVNAAMAVLA